MLLSVLNRKWGLSWLLRFCSSAYVCSLHAAVSHFLDELLVVLLEELQQRLAFHAQPEAGVPQPGGGLSLIHI